MRPNQVWVALCNGQMSGVKAASTPNTSSEGNALTGKLRVRMPIAARIMQMTDQLSRAGAGRTPARPSSNSIKLAAQSRPQEGREAIKRGCLLAGIQLAPEFAKQNRLAMSACVQIDTSFPSPCHPANLAHQRFLGDGADQHALPVEILLHATNRVSRGLRAVHRISSQSPSAKL